MEKAKVLSTARGTAFFWEEELKVLGLPFHGEGDYEVPQEKASETGIVKVTICKDGKTSPPKDWERDKAHTSILKYAFGQMFFGWFYGKG